MQHCRVRFTFLSPVKKLTMIMERKQSEVGRKLTGSPRDGVRMSVPPPLLFQLTAAAQFLPSPAHQTPSDPKESHLTHLSLSSTIFDNNIQNTKSEHKLTYGLYCVEKITD